MKIGRVTFKPKTPKRPAAGIVSGTSESAVAEPTNFFECLFQANHDDAPSVAQLPIVHQTVKHSASTGGADNSGTTSGHCDRNLSHTFTSMTGSAAMLGPFERQFGSFHVETPYFTTIHFALGNSPSLRKGWKSAISQSTSWQFINSTRNTPSLLFPSSAAITA